MPPDSTQGVDRWRWREISVRRVIGTLIEMLGFIGIASVIELSLRGQLDASLAVPQVVISVLLFAAGVATVYRARSAPRARG